jgi:dTMP kinase
MNKGLFITIEGMDGSGKSTQIKLLKKYLEELGKEVVLTREPGGTRIGERIREILLDPKSIDMKEETEILLYAAARAQIVSELILPELKSGKTVICDRFYDSSFAYQGYGRNMSLEIIKSANSFAMKEAKPDLTIFVDISPEKARKRIEDREIDRLEMEGMAFHNRVYEGFKILARNNADRIKVVKADREVDEIFNDIKVIIKDKFISVR